MNKGVIDIGNTRVKSAVFTTEGDILARAIFNSDIEALQWLNSFDIHTVLYSSVNQIHMPAFEGMDIIPLNHTSKIPFKNLYKSPETLGLDRIASMAAANSLFPNTFVLVFDIGTCMTIDLMHSDNSYYGGNISPGLEMRLNAMHEMTGRLPLASINNAIPGLGNNTLTAMASGVIEGMQYEIQGYIDHYLLQYPGLIVVLCGGDHRHFDIPPKYKIFAAPDFVLQGLYQLLLLNEK